MDIEGRVALVTGGAHRVGRAISVGLAAAGAHVMVNYFTSADEATETIEHIRSLGGHATAVQADVSTVDGIRSLARATATGSPSAGTSAGDAQGRGRLDILVNSASLFEQSRFEDISESDWDRVLAVNLKGPFLLSQAMAPRLRAGGGTIINIADLSALQPWPSFAHHAVSKAGLLHLTRVLARALAPDVRVNCIIPGTVLPPDSWEGEDYAGGRDRRVVEHEGRPEDVVDALLYLVRSPFVTGQSIIVDGGRTLL